MTRRQFIRTTLGLGSVSNCIVAHAAAVSFHCTPSPRFPVPLTQGVWHSQEFPVGKHDYHVWLNVDRQKPIDELDCGLEFPRHGRRCSTQPLLDLEWKIWDGTGLVENWPAKPIEPGSWSDVSVGCFLGDFKGKKDGHFTLELNVKRDPGRLKDLHPRVQIVKNPGYWCWL